MATAAPSIRYSGQWKSEPLAALAGPGSISASRCCRME